MDTILERFASLSPEKREILLKKLKKQDSIPLPDSIRPQTIQPALRNGDLPLSFAQQRLWFLAQMEPDSPFYNIPAALHLKGPLAADILESSINELIRRHEVFRTTFVSVNGAPVQIIAPALYLPLPVEDLRSSFREAAIQEQAIAEARCPFDLEKGPLLRVRLLQVADEEHVFLLTLHHIIADGWSMGVLIRELAALYNAFLVGQPSPLPDLPIQYVDYACWQHQWLQGEVLQTQLSYWQKQLGSGLPVLELATDHPRPPMQTFNGAVQSRVLPRKLVETVAAFSRQEGVTLFMTLLTVFKVLLHRYTGQTDIVVGTDIANRNLVEVEPLIGFFVNTLVLRANLTAELSFRALLNQVRETALAAYAHQDIPFEKVVEALKPERDMSHPPVFQVMFSLRNVPLDAMQMTNLTARPLMVHTGTSKFDIELTLVEMAEGPALSVEYNTDLFETATISRMLGHFQVLLETVLANPDQSVGLLPLLTEAERHQLVVEWNDTAVDFPKEHCFPQLFEAQAARTPHAVAAVCRAQQVTYGELNAQSNRLASCLIAESVESDVVVALLGERGIPFLTAMIGVFKAGGAYLPLDPLHPPQRIAQVLEQSGSPIILVTRPLQSLLTQALERLTAEKRPKVFLLEDLLQTPGSSENPQPRYKPGDLAYVIYTSGSTGIPKGAMVEHVGMLNHLYAKIRDLQLTDQDTVAETASQCFDISVWQFLAALLLGGQVFIYPDEVTHNPALLLKSVAEDQITIWEAVPSMMRLVLEEASRPDVIARYNLSALRWMIPTGEALPPTLCREWFAVYPLIPLLNAYGPTECSDDVTHHPIDEPPPMTIVHMPIGRPIMNMRAYVVDKNLLPVPIGVRGELCIGGIGVGRGYLHDPQRTSAVFRQDPFTAEPNTRLYRTGDLVRYLPDGSLEFLGRLDYQVKIRGFRIELGEIETVLRQHERVQEAVLIAKEDEFGDKKLVAYLTQHTTFYDDHLVTHQVSSWHRVWDEVYDPIKLQEASPFESSGWNSSYTGWPIPENEMEEWLNQTVNRIKTLQPEQVLEIGCGSGLLLFQIAPHVHSYFGTDFVREPLDYIQRRLAVQPLPMVRIEQREANDLDGIPDATFDTIILNSVIQYFPSVDYLLTVLQAAVRVVKPGGAIFLGDVRSLPLLEAFHTSVQLYHAGPTLTKAQFQQRVQVNLTKENELVVDPGFFLALKRHVPNLVDVQILLKRGTFDNELTKFRYDVVLHIAAEPEQEVLTPVWFEWHEGALETLPTILAEQQPDIFCIANVPNGRLHQEVAAMRWLAEANDDDTLTSFHTLLPMLGDEGVDPERFWQLGDFLPYRVAVSWNHSDPYGRYQVQFKKRTVNALIAPPEMGYIRPWNQYANDPMRAITSEELIPQLHEFLREKLPDYMIPATFVFLDTLPLTPNGKINRRALPDPQQNRSTLVAGNYLAPRNLLELQLVQIWEKVLDIRRVGVRDNFFEIGGHSLLAARLVSQIQRTVQHELPLSALFQAPTIEALASLIQQRGYTTSQGPVVAIQPEGDKQPIFCVHPAGGNVLCYYELARHMGTGRPFYGIEAVGLSGAEEMPGEMEVLAARYVAAVRQIQPQGPYLLGGWCSGGLVAHAMAQQLWAQGEKVVLLALLDTSTFIEQPAENGQVVYDEVDFFVATLKGAGHEPDLEALKPYDSETQLVHLLAQAKASGAVPPDVTLEYMRRYLRVYEANMRAEMNYQIRPYPGPMILFRAGDHPATEPADLGWGQFAANGLEVVMVPGDHNSMIEDRANASVLGTRLKEALDRVA